jgi:hypothetical protein
LQFAISTIGNSVWLVGAGYMIVNEAGYMIVNELAFARVTNGRPTFGSDNGLMA